jgi:hypothetical protein
LKPEIELKLIRKDNSVTSFHQEQMKQSAISGDSHNPFLNLREDRGCPYLQLRIKYYSGEANS